jgi:hypothetical protein
MVQDYVGTIMVATIVVEICSADLNTTGRERLMPACLMREKQAQGASQAYAQAAKAGEAHTVSQVTVQELS